jgi:hypothetical protein
VKRFNAIYNKSGLLGLQKQTGEDAEEKNYR